jgi:hypothetical protein
MKSTAHPIGEPVTFDNVLFFATLRLCVNFHCRFWVNAFCPALKEEGETQAEARANVREVMEFSIESLDAHGEPVPREHMRVELLSVAVRASFRRCVRRILHELHSESDSCLTGNEAATSFALAQQTEDARSSRCRIAICNPERFTACSTTRARPATN